MTIFPFTIKLCLCKILLFHEYFQVPISGQPVIDCGFQFCLGLLVYGLMLHQFQWIVKSNSIELVMQLNFGMTHFALLPSTIAM